jgi:hypothetical protein
MSIENIWAETTGGKEMLTEAERLERVEELEKRQKEIKEKLAKGGITSRIEMQNLIHEQGRVEGELTYLK